MVKTKIRLIIFFAAKDGKLYQRGNPTNRINEKWTCILMSKPSLCARCIVRPNKKKNQRLQQRKFIDLGHCPPGKIGDGCSQIHHAGWPGCKAFKSKKSKVEERGLCNFSFPQISIADILPLSCDSVWFWWLFLQSKLVSLQLLFYREQKQ